MANDEIKADEVSTQQVLTVAYIHLGCNATGNVSISIRKSQMLDSEPAIKEKWDRACKAFVDAFSADTSLLAIRGGQGTSLREHAIEKAQRDGAKIY